MAKRGPKPLYEKMDIPSKFDSVTGWVSQGYRDCDIAELLEVSNKSIVRWKRDHPDFKACFKKARRVVDGEIVLSAVNQAKGFFYTEQQAIRIKTGQYTEDVKVVEVERYHSPVPVMAIFMLKNRIPTDYADRRELDVQSKVEHVFNDTKDHELTGELSAFLAGLDAARAGKEIASGNGDGEAKLSGVRGNGKKRLSTG